MQSAIFEDINKVLEKFKQTPFAHFVQDSFIFSNLDFLILSLILILLISSTVLDSSKIGFFAILIIFLSFFKLLFNKNTSINFTKMDFLITIYYLIVTVSLFASSNFGLSLHGYLKILVYWALYYSLFLFFKDNRRYVLPIFFTISILATIQSAIGILQNSFGVLEISTWQDVSKLDATEVLSRCYGTLKPYNPNLLAGYLISTISSICLFLTLCIFKKHKKRALLFGVFLILNFLCLFYTGCRGAYIALFAIILLTFSYFYKLTDGFKSVQKRIKTLFTSIFSAFFIIVLSMPPIYKRILSIFLMRGDSSTSFRMNVYSASFKMFLDNPFLGIGVGNQNFREVYGLYMKTGFDALGAYSVPLEIAVESGIFALIAFILFLICAIQKILSYIFNSKNTVKTTILFSILIMLTGTMVHGFFDTVFFRPQIQVIFWLNIAILNLFFNEKENI